MLINIFLLTVGFVILIKGADWLVSGASDLARKLNVSDLAIGLTIVAFGTSAPELVVNTFAAYDGNSDIVFGNIIGSNNFNLFFILGLAGVISPLVVKPSTAYKEIPLSFLAVIILLILSNDFWIDGETVLSRIDGVILFVFFMLFLYYVYTQMRENVSIRIENKIHSNFKIFALIFFGLVSLVGGGRLVLDSSVYIAQAIGISEKVIGLTIIAAGTSLPELATSIVAAIKKNSDIAVGNIIGSNIFNIFMILSVSSIIKPVKFNQSFNNEMYLLAFGTIFLFLSMFSGIRKKIDRWEAIILFSIYFIYTTFIIFREIS